MAKAFDSIKGIGGPGSEVTITGYFVCEKCGGEPRGSECKCGPAMTENDALAAIEEHRQAVGREVDGFLIDSILGDFLRAQGYGRLADAMDNAHGWRA